MENIAFTTLVILILAVPGYMARLAYYSEDFTKDVLPKNLTEEISLAILYSLPFHIVALKLIDYRYINYKSSLYVDIDSVFALLLGKNLSEGAGEPILSDKVYQHFDSIVLYFIGLAIVAVAVGWAIRKAVWRWKLDVKLPTLFRYRNRWLYTFTGRERLDEKELLFPIVDAMCLLGGEDTRLYRGVIIRFDTNDEGDLAEIHLGLAFRGKFLEDQKGKKTHSWKEIPGDYLVLKYDNVQSLNISLIPESLFNPDSPSFLKTQSPAQ